MRACVVASNWWGLEGEACVAWDGWRCMEAWSLGVVDPVLMVSAWWFVGPSVGPSIVVPVMQLCVVDQQVVVPALPSSWSAPWVVAEPLLEVQDQVELLEEVFQCQKCTLWENQRCLVPCRCQVVKELPDLRQAAGIA